MDTRSSLEEGSVYIHSQPASSPWREATIQCGAHGGGELDRPERLAQDRRLLAHGSLEGSGVGKSTQEQDRQVSVTPADSLRSFSAVHPGHREIDNKEIR